jgi:thiol-disulfide isomerase/thioredoxin
VQYRYDFLNKQIDPTFGTLGIDTNGDGDIDMDSLSPEAAQVKGDIAIFRVDNIFLSTKKADLQKNSIVLREHSAKEYKRIELSMGNVVPDFEFTDFKGKKRKFSEFRGKYVLLDIWGFWCPACKDELPYVKEAYNRFQSRNFEIVGLNTDEYTIESIRTSLDDNGMKWTQATRDSILPLLAEKMMIRSFPTTMLISPEGKIISRGRVEKDEPDLRGADLLETLDDILPK